MRLFDDNTGWEEARRAVRYTRAALLAAASHEKLAAAMTKLLDGWTAIEEQRRTAEDAGVDANALVHFHDVTLDAHVTRLAAKTRGDHGEGSRELQALFPEAPNEIVRLGLESEIVRAKKWKSIGKEVQLSKGVQAVLKDIDATCAQGDRALAAREAAVTEAARISLRVSKWKDDANGARRSIETALDDYANSHGLGRDYASAFFPAAPARAKKARPTPTAVPAPPPAQ